MDQKAAKAIAKWVKKGGVLLLLTNDSSNCELVKFNQATQTGAQNEVRKQVRTETQPHAVTFASG